LKNKVFIKKYRNISKKIILKENPFFFDFNNNIIQIKNEILNNNVLDISKEILKIIEKYKNLGIIKKFGTEIRNSFLSSFFNY